jgi:hypothetical protein
MARRVFFSFEYEHDVSRANVVRQSGMTKGFEAAGYVDATEFEKVKRRGDAAIQEWIDDQLTGTSVTAVLVGADTCSSKWVQYEIDKSIKRGNGLLGVDISQINDLQGNTTTCCGSIPKGYDFYRWFSDKGYENLGTWIEKAAKAAEK